jgi:hypothetical protein
MELEKKISELREKQAVISQRKEKKKAEIEALNKQYSNIENQIKELEERELRTTLEEQATSPVEASQFFKEIKKLDITPLEAIELIKALGRDSKSPNSENTEISGEAHYGI